MSILFRVLRVALIAVCLSTTVAANAKSAQEQTFTINFRDTELEEVVRFVAQVTGKTIIVDPKAKGHVQVISSKPLNKEQLYDLFLSILDVNGFAAIETDGVVKIIPARDAKSSAAPVVGSKTRDNSAVVTEVIQLKNVSAATLIPVLRPLAPQQAHMAAYGPSNAIIISDMASNIASIRAVIDRIDKAAVGETEVIHLQHASSEEVVRMLNELDKNSPSKGQPEIAGKSLTLVADKRTNSVIVSGDDMQRRRVRMLIGYLDGPAPQSGNVRVHYLQYANAKDLAAVLNKVMQNVTQLQPGQSAQSSGKGKATIEADEGTNSLIITADADVMASLEAVIDRLDIRRAQVLVEAIIVDITAEKDHDLGIQWMFANAGGGFAGSSLADGSLAGAAASAFGVDVSSSSTTTTDLDPRYLLGETISGTEGQVFGIGRISNNFSFTAVLQALQKNVDANILSTPSLLTLDNEEASIVVGQEVPFKTGSYTQTGNSSSVSSPFETIQRQNVGLTLKVTPHINEGDSLVMEISQEVSSLSGDAGTVGASDVITNERKIESKVLSDNGETVVLGGLIKDEVQQTAQKVPLLGDLPVVGRLFRSSSAKKVKTNLMVFLHPVIVRDGRQLTGATGEKYRYIRSEQLKSREDGSNFIEKHDMPLLPEWEEQLKKVEAMQRHETLPKSTDIPVSHAADGAAGTTDGKAPSADTSAPDEAQQ